jgi:DNA-binding IclR family transcriptional regulator
MAARGSAPSTKPEALYVARAMQVLELLAFRPMSAPQVAATLQIHPRTARRVLVRLHGESYLARTDDTRRLYSPTLRLIALAGQAAHRLPLVREADGAVGWLSGETGMGAFLASPSYGEVVVLASAGPDAPRPLSLLPVNTSAAGRVLLAHRQRWRDSQRFVRNGNLDEDAAAGIRRRGHAVSDDRCSVAVVVPTADPPIAALALVGEAGRLGAEQERAVALLHEAADILNGNIA